MRAATRRRLDVDMVRRGLAPSRVQARDLIAAGRVTVSGAFAAKASRQVDAAEPVELLGAAPRYVSRAGAKLEAALDRFAVSVTGLRVLDAGAATGGFTDCLLQHGAAVVVAVDVGHGQFHERLLGDDRVELHERLNVRGLDPSMIGGPVDAVAADLSFISLRTVLPALMATTVTGGALLVLVKPQFEAGRLEADRSKGIIRDPDVWHRTLLEVIDAFGGEGASIMGVMKSPILGTGGNVEFLLHARAAPHEPGMLDGPAVDAHVAAAVADARNAAAPHEDD